MRHVQLADGTVFEIYRCGAAQGVLWIGIQNVSVNDAAEAFSDPENTQQIISYFDGDDRMEEQFDGYTELIRARQDDYGVLVALRKE